MRVRQWNKWGKMKMRDKKVGKRESREINKKRGTEKGQ